MEVKCFGCGLPGMGAARDCLAQMVSLARRSGFARFAVLVLAGLALVLSGCASHRSGTPNASGAAGFNEPQVSPFGTIQIADESSPASFSFQKAKGKLGSAKDAIKDSAGLGLSGPGAGLIVSGEILSWFGQSDFLQGLGNAGPASLYVAGAVVGVAGVAGGATTVGAALAGPLVGAEGLVRSLKSVSPAELAERESALTNALSQMATQEPFRDALRQTAAEKLRGGFSSPADAVLDVRVDDLRLERAGSSEGSYFLRIRTHARLIRAADGTVCFEQSAEYRSGKCLFLDWTTHGAVESVAETGYHALASYYIDQLVAGPAYSRAH